MTGANQELIDALTLAERACREATSNGDETPIDAGFVLSILRRLVRGRTVHEIYDAFGAPGDFGYETPIGAALHRLYRKSTAKADTRGGDDE